jgi:hypothetical protein
LNLGFGILRIAVQRIKCEAGIERIPEPADCGSVGRRAILDQCNERRNRVRELLEGFLIEASDSSSTDGDIVEGLMLRPCLPGRPELRVLETSLLYVI